MENTTRGHLTKDGIRIYEAADYAGMHGAGLLAAEILDGIAEFVVPGVTTARLDEIITNKIETAGAKSADHWLQRLSTRELYFGEPCGLSRNSRV